MAAGVLRQPEVAHRLDAETGGLVLCGKTTAGLQGLCSAFASRRILKRYRAVVRGALRGCGRITLPVSGAPSETEYRSVAVKPSSKCMHVTVVDLWPRTGRTHQLRKHLACCGHPILGDKKYWGTTPFPESELAAHVIALQECELAASADREAAVLRGEGDAGAEADTGGVGAVFPPSSSVLNAGSGPQEVGVNGGGHEHQGALISHMAVHVPQQGNGGSVHGARNQVCVHVHVPCMQ
ncbi:MAG: RNA pseudouridine synthase [Akkermansiaceae bacterium]|nr:RNA pseudouridine synthase [Akkermansiaceae bacterium]